MLDNEQTPESPADTSASVDSAETSAPPTPAEAPAAQDDSLPKPPAGRRSRRRPAGPPAEAPQLPAQPVQATPSEADKSDESDKAGEPDTAGEAAQQTEAAEGEAEPEAEEAQSDPEESQADPEQDEEDQDDSEENESSDELEPAESEEEPEEPAEAPGDDDDDSEEDSGDDSEEPRPRSSRRRRRRRGGRRRGGAAQQAQDAEESQDKESKSEEDSDDESASNGDTRTSGKSGKGRGQKKSSRKNGQDKDAAHDSEQDDASEGAGADDAESAQASGTSSSARRRRRRRRRSGSSGDLREAGSGTDTDQVAGIEGSTRLEAKRQRRREGRAAGRRRAPILSEAEFLARRESVKRQMVLRQQDEYTQIAVLEDGVLVEHYVDRESSSSLIGNVYLGRVQNVLPSMEAAFIDIGLGRNAVLYAGEVDWDQYGAANSDRKIEQVLKSGQQIVVQVSKDPVGAKGARLTNHVSIPGRYVVYAPGGHLSGISRKLPDTERKRLKTILAGLIDESASVIVRTAAEGAAEEQLVHDVDRLKKRWDKIEKKAKQGGAPQLLYGEPDLTIRTVRDLFTEDFAELIIDGNGLENDAYESMVDYISQVAPHLQERIEHWDRTSKGDVFSHYRLDEQIAKALERKVHLPSGGSLIIDRTEAMTVIDVNTGKFTGHGGNLEATVTANNLEAAEEIVRQLRLRDIGGIIVVDFIDMVLASNRELLLRRLVESLGRDRTRHQVSEVTSLGLVQMTRKKIGTGLAEVFTEPCEGCNHRGYHIHDMPVATQAPSGGERGSRGSGRRRGRGRGGNHHNGPSRNGQQKSEQKDQVSVEARAAAQAAMNAVAHAGSRAKAEEAEAAKTQDAPEEAKSQDVAEEAKDLAEEVKDQAVAEEATDQQVPEDTPAPEEAQAPAEASEDPQPEAAAASDEAEQAGDTVDEPSESTTV